MKPVYDMKKPANGSPSAQGMMQLGQDRASGAANERITSQQVARDSKGLAALKTATSGNPNS